MRHLRPTSGDAQTTAPQGNVKHPGHKHVTKQNLPHNETTRVKCGEAEQ